MEASRVIINNKTYDLNYLSRSKKINLRRKLIVEYIQSKPAGEYIKMEEFRRICHFTAYSNAWAFIKLMIRDEVIQQHEGERKKAYYYSVIGAMRVTSLKDTVKQLPDPDKKHPDKKHPDITSFIADMQELGVEFTITISSKGAAK